MRNNFQIKLSAVVALAIGCAGTVLFGRQEAKTKTSDISGRWHFVLQTQDGPREYDATFRQDGDKISGKWGQDTDVKGTFSDGKLALAFPANSEEVGPGTLKIDGELQDDALSGNWSFQEYDGTFKATRMKPAG